jgi:hypothetical protein
MATIHALPQPSARTDDDGLWPRLVSAVADNGMGPDFSGIRAHATLEIHMRECAERHAEWRASQTIIHTRIDHLSNRLWAAATTIIVLLLGASGTMAWFLLTKGAH